MSDPAEVFISYARSDAERVYPLVDRLRDAGATVWIDRGSDGAAGIDGAVLWGQEIVAAIERARVLVLMASPASFASPNVIKEVVLASENRKPILPLYLEPATTPPALRYPLAGIQHVELHLGAEGALRSALKALDRHGVSLRLTESERRELRLPAGAAPAGFHAAPSDLGQLSTRFWAGMIDLAFAGMVAGVLDTLIRLLVGSLLGPATDAGDLLPTPIVLLAYSLAFEASRLQGTPGKFLLHLQTVDAATGGRPTFAQALRRSLGLALTAVTVGIGFLVARGHPLRQTLHDRLAHTLVVNRPDRR